MKYKLPDISIKSKILANFTKPRDSVNEESESVKVLGECIALQQRKSIDYQNDHSKIKQADYYPNGVGTIMDLIHAKKLRMESVIAAMVHDPEYKPNFESIEDSAKDAINYYSFIVAWCRKKMDGQNPNHDFLNRPKRGNNR